MVSFYPEEVRRARPFKYYKMWQSIPNFHDLIRNDWQERVIGTPMFIVVMKLKRLKNLLRRINKESYCDVKREAEKSKEDLETSQQMLRKDPLNELLIDKEKICREKYMFYYKAYNAFLAQKSKVEWMRNGDENTAVFHASLRARHKQNRVNAIMDDKGRWVDTVLEVQKAFFRLLLDSPWISNG